MTDLLAVTDHPSPNHDDRPAGIDMIVLHYTGMETGSAALARLCDPAAKVSAHYLVEEDGRIFRLVPEEKRAWHAGVSHWQGQDGVNDTSIGIEIAHPGHEWGYRPFAQSQIDSVLHLVQEICMRNDVSPLRVIGHSDVAPERKEDPGELFPWLLLAEQGLAIAPVLPEQLDTAPAPAYETCLTMLREIGYQLEGVKHAAPVLAFQRRFFPSALGRGLDGPTRKAISTVHKVFTNT
ncbi:N-acetylmuramoyl-L-alanine amidase [Parvularcula sp. IMCC14364]|uniref:N-acetylmuramoyl-L-alanine amidase n=1 Tax=Parvularcula sp. IMCC14364 TaxID=3067902 RepID=UPI002741D136|nr:N-acetylmuramoyl-L-alanine amidase [Parvularcula sp. IMCC14364]